ncbi:MAG: hypothetical protein M5R36_06995 [Deltaproteobacteria bacterium]|nr:hypothetical protein [Deltaproteobacteria bacterium]
MYYAPAYNVSQETLTEFEAADLRLEDGNTYYVQLLAYDNSFNESAPTSEISFTLDDDTRPVPPTNLDATAGVGSVTLTWTASEDVDVKGYRVYRGTSQGFTPGPGNMIVDESAVEADDTQFTDTTVSACETYVYKVAAVDCVDAGEASDEAYGDGAGGGDDAPVSGQTNTTSTEDPASAPNPPSPFGATGGNQNVHLSWTSPSAPDFEKLVIRYATTTYPGSIVAGSLAGEVECAPGATFSFDHTGLTNGITYYYSAFACDRCGNCSAAAQSSAMPNLAGPVVQIITPGAGQVINDGELVYQARAYDPDQADLSATPNVDTDNGKGIAAITFHVTPEPTDSGWPRAEYAKEYCGFGGDMNPCAEGDVSTWCAGTYDLYVVAQDDEGQTTQSPYTQIVVQSGGIDDDQTYTKTISGTNNQILTFQVINSSDASVKLLGLQAEWDRANARLGGVAVPAGTVIWTDADLGHQAASGEEFTFDTGSQPTIGAGDSATIQLVFEHFATTLAGVAGPGSTSISVSSSAGFSAGDTVYIDSGAGQEAVQVASVSTGVLNLTGAVSGTHIYGARVSLTANDNEMNMAGALVNVSLNYEKSSGGLVCESDDIAVVVAAGPVIGTPYQDEPSANTSMSQTVGLVHVQNYRPVPVHVTVTDYSGTGLSSVRAYYKVDSGMATTPPSTGYAYVDMAYDSGDARWEGTIPFATNARVWVYFLATDNQSATDRKPPSGAYTYDLDADTTPPSCPLGLVATAVGGDDIDLDWQKNSEEDVIGYNVYRRKDCGNWAKVYTQVTDQETGSPDVVDYTDNAPQLNPGNFCYGYYLRAVDSSGNQSESCESYTADAGDCPCP